MLTQTYLKSILYYNPETGIFTWLELRQGVRIKNDIAGSVNYKGYLLLCIDGKLYRQHRLAWLYMTGEWPTKQIDHINNNKKNNKWSNLREADNQTNHYNLNKPVNNTSGAKGVRKLKNGNWSARIKYNKKEIWLGTFKTLEEASDSYFNKAKELADKFANRGH